jgi:hypothetical protein
VIDLFWLLFFTGGGAAGGYNLWCALGFPAPYIGCAVGVIVGYLVLVGIGNLNTMPETSCVCGRDDYEFNNDAKWGNVRRCTCGRRYILRKGSTWSEILDNGQVKLRAKLNFFNKWKPIESQCSDPSEAGQRPAPPSPPPAPKG